MDSRLQILLVVDKGGGDEGGGDEGGGDEGIKHFRLFTTPLSFV